MKAQTRNAVAAAVVLLALCAVPFLSGKFAIYLTMRIMLLGIFALGYNLLLGQTGLLSFGHGAFYAAGAYGLGFCWLRLSGHPLAGIVAGVAAALSDMDAAIADGKYKDAKVKAEAAKATLDKIVADVQAAIDAKKGK